ncbi:hypothetical protein [Botryobacter ruber]|uniref:hypothetical protein n=1 Tax=Botryobacter ruber TaxID=2171629 RepID=UPI000E0BE0A1|nr:hypothetical protein [Botryobacter ruber]
MAELDVRPKKKSPWWLWLLLALIVIAVIFFFVGNDDNKMEEDDTYEPETGAVDSPSATFYAFTNTVALPAQKTA